VARPIRWADPVLAMTGSRRRLDRLWRLTDVTGHWLGFVDLGNDPAAEFALDEVHASQVLFAGRRATGRLVRRRSVRGRQVRGRRARARRTWLAGAGVYRAAVYRLGLSGVRPRRVRLRRVGLRGTRPRGTSLRGTSLRGVSRGRGHLRVRRPVRREGTRRHPTELSAEKRFDLEFETERGGQDPAQVPIAAAAGKTLDVAFPGKPDGEDAVLHRVHRGVAEQHPSHPALALDGLEDLRPALADRLVIRPSADRRGASGLPSGSPGVLPPRGFVHWLGRRSPGGARLGRGVRGWLTGLRQLTGLARPGGPVGCTALIWLCGVRPCGIRSGRSRPG
jgi:hypothetical protein